MTKKFKKITAKKQFLLDQKVGTIYLSLGLQKGCPSYRRKAFSPHKRTSSTSKHESS
jgi:hypothetical protein